MPDIRDTSTRLFYVCMCMCVCFMFVPLLALFYFPFCPSSPSLPPLASRVLLACTGTCMSSCAFWSEPLAREPSSAAICVVYWVATSLRHIGGKRWHSMISKHQHPTAARQPLSNHPTQSPEEQSSEGIDSMHAQDCHQSAHWLGKGVTQTPLPPPHHCKRAIS